MYEILDICSSLDNVRADVIKNHDNNLWWPLNIDDYRKRLLIAGLSTRVSYNMIGNYIRVIEKLNKFTYEELSTLNDAELIEIIKPLGLSNTRLKYMKSMFTFIMKYEANILAFNNEELIELIANYVKGASYKVAQCCVLYINDYHCEIMPVDSGMKDMMLPCIGFNDQKGGIGHEHARKELESVVRELDLKPLIIKNGYQHLKFPEEHSYMWWAHLVLIYYKRHYCNKHNPNMCPINHKINVLEKCTK